MPRSDTPRLINNPAAKKHPAGYSEKAVCMIAFITVVALFFPFIASAHEVYVLSPDITAAAIAEPPFSEWSVLLANLNQFFFWAFAGAVLVLIVFVISISKPIERKLDPYLAKLPRHAPTVGRVTIGVSFVAAAYYEALFGPEITLAETFGIIAPFIRALLALLGLMIVTGVYVRAAALAGLTLFTWTVTAHGWYLLTYTNYAGELLVLLVLGAHTGVRHIQKRNELHLPARARKLMTQAKPYMFPILRIAFGISLIYASVYAKIIHNQLAYALTIEYPELVSFFGFEPHFLVLGAAIVEIMIGLFFILGIEVRFTALFLLFWLSLSLWYFGEAVWPHLILIGIPISFIMYGYDKYTLEGRLFKRDGLEPVL